MSVLVPAALILLAGGAMMSPFAGMAAGAASPLGLAAMLVMFMATFAALAFDAAHRSVTVAMGAVGSLVVGISFGFYYVGDAAVYLGTKADTLVLLSGVSVVAGVLESGGFFQLVAVRVVRSSGTSPLRVMVRLCLLTFVLSMFMNNLATILVMVPLSLHIARALRMDARALIIGEVIASNLGGASTMVGDFPNILMATEAGLPFHAFLLYLAPVCFAELGILLWYLSPSFPSEVRGHALRGDLAGRLEADARWDSRVLSRGLAIGAAMVAGFTACGPLGVSPAVVAVVAAAAAFAFGGVPWQQLAGKLSLDEVLFFSCLFVMVGAVTATGILDGFGAAVGQLWHRSPMWGAIATAWAAALLTCVLSAGPTTALLLDVLVTTAARADTGPVLWWALSLGVCAGSSATLTGATAGPIAAGLMERHGMTLSFNRFARTGIPIMFAFLLVSSCYLAALVSW